MTLTSWARVWGQSLGTPLRAESLKLRVAKEKEDSPKEPRETREARDKLLKGLPLIRRLFDIAHWSYAILS